MKWIFYWKVYTFLYTHIYLVFSWVDWSGCTGEYRGKFVTVAAIVTRGGLAPVGPAADRLSSSSILMPSAVICDSGPCGLVGEESACSCNLTPLVSIDMFPSLFLTSSCVVQHLPPLLWETPAAAACTAQQSLICAKPWDRYYNFVNNTPLIIYHTTLTDIGCLCLSTKACSISLSLSLWSNKISSCLYFSPLIASYTLEKLENLETGYMKNKNRV